MTHRDWIEGAPERTVEDPVRTNFMFWPPVRRLAAPYCGGPKQVRRNG